LNASLASLRNENKKIVAKAKELDVCNVSISNLRDENDILHAKIVELNSCKLSTSTVEHITICTRCRDINIDAIHDHIAMIKQQNDHIARLDAKIAEHELENEKFKFARSMCRRFDPGGSLDRRVNCRCVSQPRWVGARRNTKEGETVRGNHGLRVVLRPGRMRLQ
jgi:hypothetical protein